MRIEYFKIMKTIYYNQEKIRKRTRSQFSQWYDEFKKFISATNLPSYRLDFYSSKYHCTLSCIHPEDPIHDIHVISVNELLLATHGESAKPIAFHEFTHIYDSAYFYKLFGNQEHRNIITPYSEYHASQIQTMCALCMESIFDDKPLTLHDRVQEGLVTERFTVQSYIQYINDDIIQTIDYYYSDNCTDPIESRFIDILRHITYYFGIIDVISCHLVYNSYIENKCDYITSKIGNDIQILHDKLNSFNCDNLQNYYSLYDLWIRIGIEVTSALKDKLQGQH